jgi:flagellar hook protein FlgE
MKMASAAYKANAKMIKASNEMTQELLETLR